VICKLDTTKTKVSAPVLALCSDTILLMIELAGSTTGNQAIWSHLVRGGRERTPTATDCKVWTGSDSTTLYVDPSRGKYYSTRLAGSLVLLHEELTTVNRKYIIGGTDTVPSPWFLASLRGHMNVPVLAHWGPALWVAGLKADLLKPVPAFGGVTVHKLSNRRLGSGWDRLMTKMVQAKTLQEEQAHG